MTLSVLGAGLLAAVSQVAADPAQAAGAALMQCVSHSAGMMAIDSENAAALAAKGLQFQSDPPARLKSMASTPYGTASFARSPATEGDVWAVGYDSGTCIVMTLGTTVEPVEQRLQKLFSVSNSWRPEAIDKLDAGSRWTQYGWDANGRHLTAQMKVQPLPSSPVKGLVMVTVSPDTKKK